MQGPTSSRARFGCAAVLATAAVIGGCGSSTEKTSSSSHAAGAPVPTSPVLPASALTIHLSSPAFADGGRIPAAFTCDGIDDSPPLSWSNLPAGTVQLALIMEDPGAAGGAITHWVVFGIPASASSIARGAIPRGAVQGTTGFSQSHYGGPCPPTGDAAHRYVFTLYALKASLTLPKGAPPADVHAAVARATLAAGRLTATYVRA
jgi:Raf kinase inhibitor-like YbhB/YbcL family protein